VKKPFSAPEKEFIGAFSGQFNGTFLLFPNSWLGPTPFQHSTALLLKFFLMTYVGFSILFAHFALCQGKMG